jgi:linoleoyl-CoA desaturase
MDHTHLKFVDRNVHDTQFFSVLRQRVNQYFKDNNLSKHNDSAMIIKTITLLSGYVLPFIVLILIQPAFAYSLILWSLMGVCMAGIGMSVMHDANHNSYSSKRSVNLILGHTLNLLGGSVFNWKLQHNHLHHTYTNIASHDNDIQDKGPLRFSPHSKVRWFHRLQPFYAVLFYSILTLYWVFFKDFVQLWKYTGDGTNKNTSKQNLRLFLKMVLDKLVYTFVFLILPSFVVGIPFYQVLTGFLIMHAIAGVILAVVFQLAHTVEGTEYPMPCDMGSINNNWAMHQLGTTVNFSTTNKIVSWYVGGLNFQVEHHLFPSVCHIHYYQLSPIVRETAKEFGLNYMENKTLLSAFRSHFKTLKRLGKLPDMDEAIM